MKLYAHQIKAINRCAQSHNFGLCVIRLPGSGKTAIGVNILKKQLHKNKPCLWIAPAHLIAQTENEWLKWTNCPPLIHIKNPAQIKRKNGISFIISYSLFRNLYKTIIKIKWGAVIVDEIHKAKNDKTLTHTFLKKLRNKTDVFIGMTGTPFQNHPHEFFNLISLIAGKNLNPLLEYCLEYKRPKEFSLLRKFLFNFKISFSHKNQGPVIGIKHPAKLANLIVPYVDYMPPEKYIEECAFPLVQEKIKRIELTDEESEIHRLIRKNKRRRYDRLFWDDDLEDIFVIQAFNRLIEARKKLININGRPASKSEKLIEDIDELSKIKGNKLLIFSNFVQFGLDIISNELIHKKIPHFCFTGKTSKKKRIEIIKNFHSGKIDVLLLSPVGFEGLDLYGATHILVLDPHFNPERKKQLIYRAIRANSSNKKVFIQHYISTSTNLPKGTADEAILRIAERKKKVNDIILNIMKNSTF